MGERASTKGRERPILFSAPMVRALLDGRKTQTRRIIKPQPHFSNVWQDDDTLDWFQSGYGEAGDDPIRLRIGRGDRLWVRETWRPVPCFEPWDMEVIYNADGEHRIVKDGDFGERDWLMPKAAKRGNVSPLFMPRWASRLTLTVSDVRVQRLNEIGADDAVAEGVTTTEFWRPKDVEGRPFEDKWWDDLTFWQNYPQIAFRALWESINGPDSWDANPWVTAYTFTVERRNIDEGLGQRADAHKNPLPGEIAP